MQDVINEVNNSGWADLALDKIEFTFDEIIIDVSDDEYGFKDQIYCKDYIGFSLIGRWDEGIIKDYVVSQGDLSTDSLMIVKKLNGADPLLTTKI